MSVFDPQPLGYSQASINTDIEIWRKGATSPGTYYQPSISVTKQDTIQIDVGGTVIGLPVEEWHRLAADKVNKEIKVVREPFSHTNSKGVKYYLNEKEVTLRGGKQQKIRYFTKDIRPDGVDYLPEGLAINENPRNGFLTVRLVQQDSPSCEDSAKESVEQEAPKRPRIDQYRKIFGRSCEEMSECDKKCCAPVCCSNKTCCKSLPSLTVVRDTDTAAPSSAVYDALAKIKELEAAKKQIKPTMRRCLVEEIKSYAQTDEGGVGDSNTTIVSYDYNDGRSLEKDFTKDTSPTQANIREDQYSSFNGGSKQYNRLQLQAHIKNLQTILNTLI